MPLLIPSFVRHQSASAAAKCAQTVKKKNKGGEKEKKKEENLPLFRPLSINLGNLNFAELRAAYFRSRGRVQRSGDRRVETEAYTKGARRWLLGERRPPDDKKNKAAKSRPAKKNKVGKGGQEGKGVDCQGWLRRGYFGWVCKSTEMLRN